MIIYPGLLVADELRCPSDLSALCRGQSHHLLGGHESGFVLIKEELESSGEAVCQMRGIDPVVDTYFQS